MPGIRLVAELDDGPHDAPVLVLANPIGTTMAIWDAQLPVLRRRFRLMRFNARGHGGSQAPPGPYSLAALGTDVLSLLDAHGIASAAFCGTSFGGMTGLWLAANAPDRVSSLVVCCTAITPMPSRQSWLERAALVRRQGMGPVSEAAPARWFTPRFIANEPAAVNRVTAMLTGCDPEGYAGCADAIADMDLRPALGAVQAPTLVISGAEDQAAPPWHGAVTARGIPGSRFVVIRGASHLANYETPGPVTDAIARHLNPAPHARVPSR
jgi:3-oxoadipate enol-lactonase